MRTQLGSPRPAGSSRPVQVKHVGSSHRSTAARATSEQTAYEPSDADILSTTSSAARDATARYPALDLDAKTQQQLSRQAEQPALRVGAKNEDTEASCLCGPTASVPSPPPNTFNPVPLVATAASVPVLANWYTTNPAISSAKSGEPAALDTKESTDAVAVTTESAPEGSPLPNSEDGSPVQVTIEVPDTPKQSDEVATVGEVPAVAEAQAGAPSAEKGTAQVSVTPAAGDQQAPQAQSETAITEAIGQGSEASGQSNALEQPTAWVPVPEASTQLVSNMLAQAPPPSLTVSNTILVSSSTDVLALQQRATAVVPVSVTQGNEQKQGVTSSTNGRYPAFNMDAATQYTASPSVPNYMPRPGAHRSSNCDAVIPSGYIDASMLQTNSQDSQLNVGATAGDYSAYYNSPEKQVQQYQSRAQQQTSPYKMYAQQGGTNVMPASPRQSVPETVAPPASPMPLAVPYSGSGSYQSPTPHNRTEADSWGILEGPYGGPQGLLHIDGASPGGSGTYGAFSYGPPSQGQSYAAPPANTQEGYRAYGPAPSQQQYYAPPPQQPQSYSQRGGVQQAYQGAPAEGYYYPSPESQLPPPQARRRVPEPQYAPPPPQGNNYTYQASPAGSMQDPYAYYGQVGGNQPYSGGGRGYSGGNQQYGGGNQSYSGNQSYAPAPYGNQAYSAPPGRSGNYAPPAESSQNSYPGIEILSPGYPEYEREHKNSSQQKPSAPPPEAYYPGIGSTYSGYGMKPPASNAPSHNEYSSNQNIGSYGYSSYTSPSNYQEQFAPGAVSGYSSRTPAAGYTQPPAAPEASYSGQWYQGYTGQSGGAYFGEQQATVPHTYGQWPTADSADKKEAATLVLPVDDAPDYSLTMTEVSGLVTSDIQSVQSSMRTQLSLEKVHQRYIPFATLPAPTYIESVPGLASVPAPSLDLGLLAAAFCCMMAAKGTGDNKKL